MRAVTRGLDARYNAYGHTNGKTMGADFTFRYHPASDHKYEAGEASSEFFISLFDADIELMKAGNVYASFVQQYRSQTGQTTQEWAESSTEEEIEETIANIPEDPTNGI